MRKSVSALLGLAVVAVAGSALLVPQERVHHESSSAFNASLNAAVDRLENGARAALGATSVLMNATPALADAAARSIPRPTLQGQVTCDPQKYTCEDYRHTMEVAQGHTCDGDFTCQVFPGSTCDTYDPNSFTCDPHIPDCTGPVPPQHTFEPPPYDHTCQAPCRRFTADITRDPRGFTCDAGNPQCKGPTFEAGHTTCNPHDPSCKTTFEGMCPPRWRMCTVQSYLTCNPANPQCGPTYDFTPTCNPDNPMCNPPTYDQTDPTCNPADPDCAFGVGIEETTWGSLEQNIRVRPNPFRTSTAIEFAVPRQMRVRIEVFDTSGRLVKKLVDDVLSEGGQSVTWDGRDQDGKSVGSGVYHARIVGEGFSVSKRLVMIE
jgi:hypothetical protein